MTVARDIETAKFTFENVFDPANTLHGNKSQSTQATQEDIIAARQEGYNEGFSAGKNDEELLLTRQIDASLEHISGCLTQLVSNLDQIEQRATEDARALAMMIARKLIFNLKKIHPTAGIETLIEDSLKQLSHAPHIVIRLNEKQLEPLREKIENISTQLGCSDRVMIVPDPDIMQPDCRIEWADGGIERDTAQIENQIEEIINRYFPLSASSEATEASATTEANENRENKDNGEHQGETPHPGKGD